jgi:hypothetical protein
MEERKVERGVDEVFENFKFVTREELSSIGGKEEKRERCFSF